MLDSIVGYLPTIFVGAIVAAAVVAAATKMWRDKKNGKSSCGGHCAGCPSAGACHTKK